ncbi:MAG: hypothetical protein OJF62_000743 [Pseudolabrys sp.]|nr:hypothetical protein [Pseudolabrys sp.]
MQCFFHCPEQIALMRGVDDDQPERIESGFVESEAARRAVLKRCHVFRDPGHGAAAFCQCESKPAGSSQMRLACRRDFMQRPDGEAAAEHGIDWSNAQGDGFRRFFQTARPFERRQCLP